MGSHWRKNPHFLFSLYAALTGAAAFALLAWATPYGAGVTVDSTTYIGGAKNLLAGNGYSVLGSPVTHYPPGFPLLLAAAGLVEDNLVRAARFLNALLFGANAVLIALALYPAIGRRYAVIALAVAFFLASGPILSLHVYAWSEPLFIALTLGCIIGTTRYAAGQKMFFLAAPALLLGLAVITRYIGAAFLPPALLTVYLAGKGQPARKRIGSAMFYAAAACLPPALLVIRNLLAAGSAANRSLAAHPVGIGQFAADFLTTAGGFLAPSALPAWARGVVLTLLAAFLVLLLVMRVKQRPEPASSRADDFLLPACCLLFAASYAVFLYFSISFLDASTPVDTRLVSPIIAVLIPGAFAAAWKAVEGTRKPALRWGVSLMMVLVILAKLPETAQTVTSVRSEGRGYTSRSWRSSESIAYVKSLNEDGKIYTNGPEALNFLAERQAAPIPARHSPLTLKANPRYDEEIRAMCAEIKAGKALLMYIPRIVKEYLPSQGELETACQPSILEEFPDGVVYGNAAR